MKRKFGVTKELVIRDAASIALMGIAVATALWLLDQRLLQFCAVGAALPVNRLVSRWLAHRWQM